MTLPRYTFCEVKVSADENPATSIFEGNRHECETFLKGHVEGIIGYTSYTKMKDPGIEAHITYLYSPLISRPDLEFWVEEKR